uniref:SMODS and SLOG-associating 2TM effector domain-containing protein n=1 Tax=Pyramimonas orientalis virus TaxID=455367 RepID=A0A7M3UP58_POV01|nr:hypothetical protein HWQ62_00388 [Pyramimonas orientalis virus]
MNISSNEWHDEHEDLLKEWAEKGRYYSWMHHKTSVDYARLNNILTLPLILISTMSGSANFSLVGKSHNTFIFTTLLPFVIGSMGITTAILSSLTKFLKTAELTEKHTMFYRQFNILVRNICLELSLPKEQRKKPSDTLNFNRRELDRLVNEAPNIPEHIVVEFNKRFPLNRNKPEIANVFEKVRIYGRTKELIDKERMLKKLRHFYKWRLYAQRDSKEKQKESFCDINAPNNDYDTDDDGTSCGYPQSERTFDVEAGENKPSMKMRNIFGGMV